MSPYESPWILIGLAATLLVVAVVRVLPTSRKWGGGLVAVAVLLAIGAAAVDELVVTDTERLEERLTTLVADFAANDADGVTAVFDDSVPMWRLAASAAVAMVDVGPDYRLTDLSADVSDATASQHFRLNGEFTVGRFGSVGRRPTRWRLDWVKSGDDWRIVDVHELDPITGEEMDRARKAVGLRD